MLKYGAKVAWTRVTLPFAEGGLAIKNLEDWNRALILMHFGEWLTPIKSLSRLIGSGLL